MSEKKLEICDGSWESVNTWSGKFVVCLSSIANDVQDRKLSHYFVTINRLLQLITYIWIYCIYKIHIWRKLFEPFILKGLFSYTDF